MTRPQTVTIVSAIVSSTAAFLVTSRWNLAGTLAGAVVLPVLCSLVSHWSKESLGSLGRLVRRHPRRQEAAEAAGAPVVPVGPDRPRRRRVSRREWLLAGCVALALTISIYSLAVPGLAQKVVVQDRVIERTVVVTTALERSDASVVASEPASPQMDAAEHEPAEHPIPAAITDPANESAAAEEGTSLPASEPVVDDDMQPAKTPGQSGQDHIPAAQVNAAPTLPSAP